MAQGTLKRAGMAILLVITLLLPYGTCQPAPRASHHDCCGQHSAPMASLKADCCIVHSELPAVVVEKAAVDPVGNISPCPMPPGPTPAITVNPGVHFALVDTSPPPGKFILRV